MAREETESVGSQDLKQLIEKEWVFVQDIVPHIPSGEAIAGYKFW